MRVAGAALLLLGAAAAQDDEIRLFRGETRAGVSVQGFDVREVRYRTANGNELVRTDLVEHVALGGFDEAYRRVLVDKDGAAWLAAAREQLAAKNALLAQAGMVEAVRLSLAAGKTPAALAIVGELQQALPDAGVLPEVHRLLFEHALRRSATDGDAVAAAERMRAAATAGKWPAGLLLESEFLVAYAEQARGGAAEVVEAAMRRLVERAEGSFPLVADRANVQIAHCRRAAGDAAAARAIYRDVVQRDGVDDTARAGALLGLGALEMAAGNPGNREPYRAALALFLRVRLQTRAAWAALQAEALFAAMDAAAKWGGEEHAQARARCQAMLLDEFGDTPWAAAARKR